MNCPYKSLAPAAYGVSPPRRAGKPWMAPKSY